MKRTDTLDRQTVKELEAFLLERRAQLQASVRARMTERRTGEPRRSPEDATNAVEALGVDLEMAVLDRHSREAAQIDAALDRLARDEYGICRTCGGSIGLGRLKALPFAQRCTTCQTGAEARARSRDRMMAFHPPRAQSARPFTSSLRRGPKDLATEDLLT